MSKIFVRHHASKTNKKVRSLKKKIISGSLFYNRDQLEIKGIETYVK